MSTEESITFYDDGSFEFFEAGSLSYDGNWEIKTVEDGSGFIGAGR
jgi:hypothetical protein